MPSDTQSAPAVALNLGDSCCTCSQAQSLTMAARLVQLPATVVRDIPSRWETPPWVRIAVTQFLLSDSTQHGYRGPEMYKWSVTSSAASSPTSTSQSMYNDFKDYHTFYNAVWVKYGWNDANNRSKNKPGLYDCTRVRARAQPTCAQTCVGCV